MRKPLIPFRSFFRDRIIRAGILISFGLTITSLIILAITYQRLPPVVPLFYSLTRGESQLASKQFLFTLPLTSLIFFLTHTWMSKIHASTERMLSRIIAVTSAVISYLFFVATIHIILIVT